MNTGADDDSLSTPTLAFCAVCAAARCSGIATNANAARLRAACANILMGIPLQRVRCSALSLLRHSGARPLRASPESITTSRGYGFRACAEGAHPGMTVL